MDPPADNPGDNPDHEPTESPTRTTTTSSTESMSTVIQTAAPVGAFYIHTKPTHAPHSRLKATIAPLIRSRLSEYIKHTTTTRPTTIPKSASTGIAVASYQMCYGDSCSFTSPLSLCPLPLSNTLLMI